MLVMTFMVCLSGHQVFCKRLVSEPTFLLPYKRELQTSQGPDWSLGPEWGSGDPHSYPKAPHPSPHHTWKALEALRLPDLVPRPWWLRKLPI